MKKLNYVIFGTGRIALEHAKAIRKSRHSVLKGIVGRDPTRTSQLANVLHVKAYQSYYEVLQDKEVDVVDIVTVNNLHAEIGIKAVRSGKHVLVEKPIDVDVEKAKILLELARKNRVKVSVISQFRYGKALKRIKRIIDEGRLGKIFLINASVLWSRSQEYYDSSNGWRKEIDKSGGGVLMVQAIHHIDILQWLLGNVECVYGYEDTFTHHIGVEDTFAGVMRFKSGAIGTMKATTCTSSSFPDIIEIHGTKGSIALLICSLRNKYLYWHFGRNSYKDRILYWINKLVWNVLDAKKGVIKCQVNDFNRAILNGEEPVSGGEDGLKALNIVRAFYHSARTGKEVQIRDLR